MKRLQNHEISSFGQEVTLRMTNTVAEGLFSHMRSDRSREQMAFALGKPAKTAAGTVFLVNDVILPDPEDLRDQTVAGVSPTDHLLKHVYWAALRSQSTIVEFHTHPGPGVPQFSSVDETHAHPNAEYIVHKFPEPVTLLMIVGNNRFDTFDGIVYDRYRGQFRQVDRFETLGRPIRFWSIGMKPSEGLLDDHDRFNRQKRIPGWNQGLLEQLRVGIYGVGGNGSPLLQTLLGIGAGRRGFIAIADHDLVEASNLPRIPYAWDCHVGTPKVAVATQYAGHKSPSTPLYAFPSRFDQSAVQERMKMATVLFFCGDSDGGRKEANEFAIRYGIPLIDLGCDVQVSVEEVIAGGQVRLVLPGENACLVCCNAFDPARAALEQAADTVRAQRVAHGYVVGADAHATPSVANLNGLAAHLAVSQLLALVNGQQFAEWDYLHFDQFTGRTVPARSSHDDDCPQCGRWGCLAKGDRRETTVLPAPHIVPYRIEPLEQLMPTQPSPVAETPDAALPDLHSPVFAVSFTHESSRIQPSTGETKHE